MITIPEAFARDTITREGEAGRKWLADLPYLVEAICHQWQLTIDGTPMHGYLGLVLPVQRAGEPYVLKVSWLDPSTLEEANALSAWNGNGAVRLLESDPMQGARLLERLNHQRCLQDVSIHDALPMAGRLLRQLAIPVTGNFRSQHSLAQEIATNLPMRWEQFGRPFLRVILDQAEERLQQSTHPTVHLLVNYDLHYENVLASERAAWLAIDPKVIIGDPEFGIAQLLVNRLEEIRNQGGLDYHFQVLCEAAELNPDLARSWTLIRCVDYWLWGLSVGLTEDPLRCERIIDWLRSRKGGG